MRGTQFFCTSANKSRYDIYDHFKGTMSRFGFDTIYRYVHEHRYKRQSSRDSHGMRTRRLSERIMPQRYMHFLVFMFLHTQSLKVYTRNGEYHFFKLRHMHIIIVKSSIVAKTCWFKNVQVSFIYNNIQTFSHQGRGTPGHSPGRASRAPAPASVTVRQRHYAVR